MAAEGDTVDGKRSFGVEESPHRSRSAAKNEERLAVTRDGQGYRNPTAVFSATIYCINGMVCCESFP